MVSVVVPTLNMAPFIWATIQSILTQTYQDFEILISDDGSTDNSLAIAASFNDPRIWLLPNDHTGVAGALNRGIRASRGEYIALLAADDLLTPDSVAIRLAAMPGVDVVCGQARTLYEYETIEQSQPIHGHRNFYGPTNLLRKSVFERYGLFDEDLPYKQDREFWVRLFGEDRTRTDRARFRTLPDVVAYFRLRRESLQHTYRLLWTCDQKATTNAMVAAAILARTDNVGPHNTPWL